MLFPTLDFGLFFLAVFAVSWAVRRRPTARKGVLVAASYVFYGYWDWHFCFLLLASALVNYAAGMLLERTGQPWRRRIATLAVAANLAVLGVFKYFDFFVASLNDLLYGIGLQRELPFLDIILPVGISFFTFQGISYVVDVYRGRVAACRDPLDVILYISFFPQLVAGPIVRAADFLPQLAGDARREPGTYRILAGTGLVLIAVGLFKKVVIANYLATELVDEVFFAPSAFSAGDLLLASYGYAIQIYCDFSAYSDIAIGVAALLGYQFRRNFDQPFRAQSVRAFWRRWHISLSTWLRDYVYIPLGGNRCGPWRRRLNVMITMLLAGLWHGAAWKFVLWGSLHGGAMVIEDVMRRTPANGGRPLWRQVLAVILVFHFLCLTFIVFRADDLAIAAAYLTGLLNWSAPWQLCSPLVLGLLTVGFAAHFLPPDLADRSAAALGRLPVAAQGACVALAILAVDAWGPEGVAPFIYFQF